MECWLTSARPHCCQGSEGGIELGGQILILNSASLQSRTALADTAGSAFTQQCEELIEADRFDEVLGKFVEHFGILFSKASQGNPTLPADAANESRLWVALRTQNSKLRFAKADLQILLGRETSGLEF